MNEPTKKLMVEFRDKVVNVALNDCPSTDIQKLRIAIDDNTKNEAISQVRHHFDGKTWPHAPPATLYALLQRCPDVGLMVIEWEEYKGKSRGGYATYEGKIHRVNAEGRRKLKMLMGDVKGCDCVDYSHKRGDY